MIRSATSFRSSSEAKSVRLFLITSRGAVGTEHHLTNRLPDPLVPGQAHRVEFREFLFDGQVFLGGAFIGPKIEITQEFDACQFVHSQDGTAVGLLRHAEESQWTEVGADERKVGGQAGVGVAQGGRRPWTDRSAGGPG
ncbi:hypothetical protein P40_16355 [Alloalcanivorax xenomutans]|nr:hypothetical protein P40_16355 [Alloalcanivorax xenomutans]